MLLFPNDELRYYLFGLRAGLKSFQANRFQLGVRKTFGKITQPVNAWSRFPEYDRFVTAIRDHLRTFIERPASILDVGSPKLLGLYLGHETTADLTLTDITDLNIAEYRVMWRALSPTARGRVSFALQDARSLEFGSAVFDVAYAMSVIEHVEGDGGDTRAVDELLRVLKPGGLLLVSVPFGPKHVEQGRRGFAGAARPTGDQQEYFFQRVYDAESFRRRILPSSEALHDVAVTTITRQHVWLARSFGRLGENVRGALGVLNPLLSMLVNRAKPGVDGSFQTSYGALHTAEDVYGDLILVGRKPGVVSGHAGREGSHS
jgi:SAM-dependent methyltransferase